MRKRNAALLASAMLALSMGLCGCTVIQTGTESQYTGEVAFDAATEAEAIWSDMVLTEVPEKAVSLSDLLNSSSDLRADDAISAHNGKNLSATETAASNSVVYSVTGTGTVTEVAAKAADPEASSKGFIYVKLDGYDGDVAVKVAVGPVISDTSIRDYLSGISLNNFSDTTEWSKISQEINNSVINDVVGSVDVASLEGAKVTFTGCFTADAAQMEEVEIVPVALSAE